MTDRSVAGYDRLARVYRRLEWIALGDHLQHSRTCLLHQLPQVRKILVLGDGDGRLLQRICQSQPDAEITSIDQSAAMIRLQQERVSEVAASQRVHWICQDGRQYEPRPNEFDLMVAAFYLDCFTESELNRHLPDWLRGVRNQGHFYVADFVQPDRGCRAIRARVMLKAMHLFFRWQTGLPNHTLVDLSEVMKALPLTEIARAECSGNMIRTQIFSRP